LRILRKFHATFLQNLLRINNFATAFERSYFSPTSGIFFTLFIHKHDSASLLLINLPTLSQVRETRNSLNSNGRLCDYTNLD
jgi:hypothetical protein